MNIWLVNHYAVPPQYYPLARTTFFAQHLMRAGHDVTIFAASMVHNSLNNLITDGAKFREELVNGVRYIYVNTSFYQGNGLKRIQNMYEFAHRLPSVCKNFSSPDMIMASSATPLACMRGIRLAKKYKCACIAEISDLWPESFVAYGLMSPHNIALKAMYAYEKAIYQRADSIVFTMQGGKDYIISRGWNQEQGGSVNLSKVHYINNGVDLAQFEQNRKKYQIADPDLDNPHLFKILYVGSIRKVNGLKELCDCANELKTYKNLRFLIYGDGDERYSLESYCKANQINNVCFKNKIDKSYIPYVLSKGDLNVLNSKNSDVLKYGGSMNKIFDYLASGKPICSNLAMQYSIIDEYRCGVSKAFSSSKEYADAILSFYKLPKMEYDAYCWNALKAAKDFDYSNLTTKLLDIMNTLYKKMDNKPQQS